MKHNRPPSDEPIMRKFRRRLAAEMSVRGLSQRELARKAGLGPTTVRHMLTSGQTVTVHSVALIADALGTRPEYLLFGLRGKQ